MPLQYLNYIDGEIYSDQALGSRYSYRLTKESVELTLEFQVTPETKGYTRIIWYGSFTYKNNKLTKIYVSDLTQATKTGGFSVNFLVPQDSFPQDVGNATKINYLYHELGSEGLTTTQSGGGYDLFKSFPVSTNRTVTEGYLWSNRIQDGWWETPFETFTSPTQSPLTGTAKKADVFPLTGTPEFGADTADRITNFNPKEKDKVQIDVSNFGSNAAGTFKIANNSKALTKALASTTDFIYLKSTGELYYNENGKLPGYGDGGIFAIIENKANITTKNVEFL